MSGSSVTVIASFKVKAGSQEAARAALQDVVGPTRPEPGCLAYDLHQSTAEPTEFMFYERWSDQDALDAHAASPAPHRQVLRQKLASMVDGRPSLTTWTRVE